MKLHDPPASPVAELAQAHNPRRDPARALMRFARRRPLGFAGLLILLLLSAGVL